MRGAFKKTEIFSGVGLDSEATAVDPENYAVWRSQGGMVDTYSKLPKNLMKEITSALTDGELTQALVWSSPRDFYVLSGEARTEEHREIVNERLKAELKDNVYTLGNSPWNDESDRGMGWALHLATAKGYDTRNEAIKSIRESRSVLERIKSQVSRGSSEEDVQRLINQASISHASLEENLDLASRSLDVSLDMRGEWLGASSASIRHDQALYSRVKEVLGTSSDAAREEKKLLGISREAVRHASECLRRSEELRVTGNTTEAVRHVVDALESLQESESYMLSSMKTTSDVSGALGYGLERARNTERVKMLRTSRLFGVANVDEVAMEDEAGSGERGNVIVDATFASFTLM
jgi:hypothetical protein